MSAIIIIKSGSTECKQAFRKQAKKCFKFNKLTANVYLYIDDQLHLDNDLNKFTGVGDLTLSILLNYSEYIRVGSDITGKFQVY